MQIIFENEDKEGNGRRAGFLGVVTCVGRDSRHMERECDGGTGGRRNGIQDGRGTFNSIEERI